MAIRRPPKFIGRVTVGTSNNRVDWQEYNGSTTTPLNTTVATGDYWLGDLLDAIATAMTTGTAYGGTYTATFDDDGTITFSVSGGTVVGFAFKITTTETNKVLTGGDAAVDEKGDSNCGFLVESAVGANALEQIAPDYPANCWFPSSTMQRDEENQTLTTTEVVTAGGRSLVRNFSGVVAPDEISYLQTRDYNFQYMEVADRDNFLYDFFLPYACNGSRFRFYYERNVASYEEMVLTEESIQMYQWRRIRGYNWWNAPLKIRRYKA